MKELLQTPTHGQTVAPAPAPALLLQRACACGGTPGPDGECAACKAKRLRRRADAPGPAVAPPIVHDVLRSPGHSLDPAVRDEMEARFGHNFSHVRVHTDAAAAESARSVAAHAYTVGSNVVFGSNRYAPGTAPGADLLAHELTHVVQQRAVSGIPGVLPVAPADDALERAAGAASRAGPGAGGARVQRQDVGDRRLRYEEVLGPAPTQAGRVWTGTLERHQILEEYRRHPAVPPSQQPMLDFAGHPHPVTVPGRPASEGFEQVTNVSEGQMTLEFDESACELRIPTRLNFHNPGRGQLPRSDPCQTNSSAPTQPLAAGVFTSLRSAFTDTINDRLNRWYSLSLEGCGAGAPCTAGVAIRIVASDVTSGGGGTTGPQVDVWLINASGRSCAFNNAPESTFIYAPGGDADRPMWAHESGHFALHFGDEYREAPHPTERVQEADYSGMATRNMSSLALLHQRHFAFAPAFVNQVMQTSGRSCRASLREVERPFVPVLSETLSAGGYRGPGGYGEYVDLGFQFGVPATRLRDWQAIIGAHARLMLGLGGDQQSALLGGIRIGLEHNLTLARRGFMLNTGIYGEAGAGAFDLGGRNEPHPYGEVGGYASLRFQQEGRFMPFVGLEAGAGGRLDLPGQIGPVSEPSTNAGPVEWMRFGIWVGFQH